MFIGARSTILPGVTLGPDVIVAAGSVVTKSFNGGVVIGGNPAHVIGKMQTLLEKRIAETEMIPAGITKEKEAVRIWSEWKKRENKNEHS